MSAPASAPPSAPPGVPSRDPSTVLVPECGRPGGATPSWPMALVDAALVIALGVLAAWPLQAAYGGRRWLLAVVVGLVLGVGLGWLSARLRWGPLLTGLAAVAGYLAVGSAVAVPDRARRGLVPTADSLRDLVLGLVRSWRESLTLPAPLGESGVVLIVPLVTGLVGGLLAAVLLWRSRWTGLAGVVLGGVLVLASAFGDITAQAVVGRGLALAAVGVVWLRWRAQRHVRGRWVRRAAATLAVVAVACGAAAGLGALGADDQRVVLRDHVDPPFDPRDYPSPLSKFRAYKKPPVKNGPALFAVDGLPSGTRVRIAVMDSYDGIVWNVSGGPGSSHDSGTFRRFRSDPEANRDANVRGRITVGDYTGVWVPSVGETLAMDPLVGGKPDDGAASELVINRQTGTVAQIGGVQRNTTYEIEAVVPPPLQDAEISLLASDPSVSLPPPAIVPEELVDRVQRWQTQDGYAGSSAGDLAQFLRDAFREHGYYSDGIDDNVPGGHGASRMALLTRTATPVGNAEQYASAMALAGQRMGLPIRVVVGFKVPPGGAVRGEHVSAWTEVKLEGAGWVPFDPTPPEKQKLRRPNDEPNEQPQPQVLQPPRVPGEPKEASDNLQQGDGKRSRVDLLEVLRTIVGVGITVAKVLLLLSPLWGVLLFKQLRRRRRRRAADAGARLTGAWRELADRARDLGVPPPPGATRREHAYAAAERYDAVPVVALADAADRHVFGPGAPTEEEARAYWADVRTALKRMRKETPWWRRVVAPFSLASVPWRPALERVRARVGRLTGRWGDRLRAQVTRLRPTARRRRLPGKRRG